VITRVAGVRVGHVSRTDEGWATGVTVVVPPPGTVAAVDVRGGGPGTHETDALAPGTLVDTADAVVLCGGSAFGLVSAHGVQRWCEEQGLGFAVGVSDTGAPLVVPVVPAACIFDLGRGGDWTARPDAEMGYVAAASASDGPLPRGAVGAGTGARTDRGSSPGGVGNGLVELPGGVLVGALAVVNAAGRVVGDPSSRVPTGGAAPALNTTLAVVVTNARLDVAEATRAAGAGHDGLARSIDPVHTLTDGDTVFLLATGETDCSLAVLEADVGWPGAERILGVAAVQAAAAEAVRLAVLDAVADPVAG
jgi:L-aminopeptidase/D-esterase-like protein